MNVREIIFKRIEKYGVILSDDTELTYKNGRTIFENSEIDFYGVAHDRLLEYVQFRNWQHTGEILSKNLKPFKNFLNGLFPYPYLYKIWLEEDDDEE